MGEKIDRYKLRFFIRARSSHNKDIVAISFILLIRIRDFLAANHLPDFLTPELRGAPRTWIRTFDTLLSVVNSKTETAYTSSRSRYLVDDLTNLIAHSGNDPDSATVTIIIPACDNVVEVATCIESITSFPSQTNYIIVIADRSEAIFHFSMFALLNAVSVVRHNSTDEQVNSVNEAAKLVATPYLLILDPATLPCPGWLDEMINEITRDPRHGVVGARILGSDFLILEAGGVIFRNGETTHRGWNSFSDDPRFNFSLEVDFVGNNALLISSELWNRLGGFDMSYEPNNYHNVDLCLRVQALDQKVMYAPLACIIRYKETSTYGKNPHTASLESSGLELQAKLQSVHHKILSTHSTISESAQVDSHSAPRVKIVCILDQMPDPSMAGGAVDFDLIIQYLVSLNYQVSLLFTTINPARASFAWRALGVLCEQFDSPHSKQLIGKSEIALSFGLSVGIKLLRENFTHKHWIHHTSDIASRRLGLMNKTMATSGIKSEDAVQWYLNMPRDEDKMWEIEKTTLEKPATVLFVTEFDLNYALEHGANGNFIHFPILKCAPDTVQIPHPLDLLTVGFVGGFGHSPNSDAVDYFLQTMWSLIRDQIPNARFLIWGSEISEQQIAKWSSVPGVEVRGWFASWEDVVVETRVFVSPLRFGAGMKHKVLSSLINGRPVIGTSTSFEGFEISHLSAAVISDDPMQIVESLVGCLNSDKMCTEFLCQGLLAMGTQFSREAEIARLVAILPELRPN